VDLLVDVGSSKSLSFAFEAARRRGYHRLRNLRNRLRALKISWPKTTTEHKSATKG
jgi:hypothetical protein